MKNKNNKENSDIQSSIKIGQTRLVEFFDPAGTYPGTVIRPEKHNGIDGYIVKFEDGPFFVPTEELLLCPIQHENSFDIPQNDLELMERERLSLLEKHESSSQSEDFSDVDIDPVVFDCSMKSENKIDDSNELNHVLDDKKRRKKEKPSKLKRTFPSKQTSHISRQRDEERTLSSFVGSKMSHTPCGPDVPFGTKQNCWRY